MKKFVIGFLVFFSLVLVASLPNKTLAAANLSLNPTQGNYNKGSTLKVNVKIDTGSEFVNAVQAYISYPKEKLRFLAVDTTGSILTVFAEKDLADGLVRIAGGRPTPGFSGNHQVGAISFEVISDSGSGDLNFTQESRVLRNSDNLNILYGRGGANFTFTIQTSAPFGSTVTPQLLAPEGEYSGEESNVYPQSPQAQVSPQKSFSLGGFLAVSALIVFILLGIGFTWYWFKLRRTTPPDLDS